MQEEEKIDNLDYDYIKIENPENKIIMLIATDIRTKFQNKEDFETKKYE